METHRQCDATSIQTLIRPPRFNITLRRQHLPYEIISRIFLECRALDGWAPAILSHVCRNWRQSALHQWELWTCIDLGRREMRLDRASAWAERAKTMGIKLAIRYTEDTPVVNLLTWMQDRARQIKSVTILHTSRNVENELLLSFPVLHRMESFQIMGLEDVDLDMRWMVPIFQGSPCLSSFSLAGVGGLHSPGSLARVGACLTHLSIGARSHIDYAFPLRVDAVLETISACSGLISLECHALGDEDDIEPQIAILPFLLSLAIGDGPDTCLLLKYLRVPKLQTLRVVRGKVLNEREQEVDIPKMDLNWDGYMELFVRGVRSLQETCSPPITRVIWDHTIANVDLLGCCAPYLPRVEELECHGISEIPASFISLSTGHYSYPSLRKMIFTKCTIKNEWLIMVQEIIMHRSGSHSRGLKQLIVEDCPGTKDTYLGRA
ncbi:hypothetical protein K439DRAFT_1661468 [Ramaria rubella]|nr:hypothetical protein K439DRAFT_1661468 [Ramaria rubella]